MGFFDVLNGIDDYAEGGIRRLNKRHAMIVAPFAARIAGGRVLDLGAHDGRWSYALAGAGAAQVVGVEARPDLIARFARFPEAPYKARVRLVEADLYTHLDALVTQGERFDTVALFGIFYHVMDHFRLLRQIRALGAGLVIIDSEFMRVKNPMIQLVMEDTALALNAAPQHTGQTRAIKGVPSFRALDRMAEALGLAVDWVDANAHWGQDRKGVQDYFRDTPMRRACCALTPV